MWQKIGSAVCQARWCPNLVELGAAAGWSTQATRVWHDGVTSGQEGGGGCQQGGRILFRAGKQSGLQGIEKHEMTCTCTSDSIAHTCCMAAWHHGA